MILGMWTPRASLDGAGVVGEWVQDTLFLVHCVRDFPDLFFAFPYVHVQINTSLEWPWFCSWSVASILETCLNATLQAYVAHLEQDTCPKNAMQYAMRSTKRDTSVLWK
jgi:hypothetical protein